MMLKIVPPVVLNTNKPRSRQRRRRKQPWNITGAEQTSCAPLGCEQEEMVSWVLGPKEKAVHLNKMWVGWWWWWWAAPYIPWTEF